MRLRRRRALFLGLGTFLVLLIAYTFKSFTAPILAKASIAELIRLDVNGDEQFLLIRGKNKELPVLLFLHGGPGMPAMYLAHDFQRDLEAHFVMVHWDQRASGKSYKEDTDPRQLSTSGLISDLDVVVDYLRDRLGPERLWLAGHSHGSYLGALYTRRNAAKVCAFIGIGQVTNDGPEGSVLAVQREFLEGQRERLDLGPETEFNQSNLESFLFRSGAVLYQETSFAPLLLSGLMAPEYSLFDSLNIAKGSSFSSRHMKYDMPRDLVSSEWQFEVPVALIMGRHDMVTPTPLARAYFDRIQAPEKAWYEFEESAHFPHFEQAERFTRALLELKGNWADCPGAELN